MNYVGRVSPPIMPVPPEGATYWDFINGNLYGSEPESGRWVKIGPSAGVTPATFAEVAGEYINSYDATTGLFTAAPVAVVDGVTISGTPSTGQVLTATSASAADWQTPAGGGAVLQTFRSAPVASLTGSTQGPYALNFPTPYADGNYTFEITAVGAEAMGTLGATTIIVAYAYPQATPGVGINAYVTNNDSITHSVTFHVFVRHD